MSNKKDNLGDRMKTYENATRYILPHRTYTLLRLDGKSFHTYTKYSQKPFDQALINVFQETTKYLCQNISGAFLGYCQSDEITIALSDFKQKETQAFFDNNLQKIASVASSMCTARFNLLRNIEYLTKSDISKIDIHGAIADLINISQGNFDCRVWTLTDPWEVFNTFYWRELDCMKNAVSTAAQSKFSPKQLSKQNTSDKIKMLAEVGIKYSEYPSEYRRGAIIHKINETWEIDKNIPKFNEDQKYIQQSIPLIEAW